MVDHQVVISGQIFKLIPHGFCACGCGGKTKPATRTDKRYGHRKGFPITFINNHNRKELRGTRNPNWKGGRRIDADGYIIILMPNHSRAYNGYVYEQVLVCEKALGKHLPPNAIPHHIDGVRANNEPSNLVICENGSYHNVLHHRQRAYEACGHASWRRCRYCHEYDDPKNMIVKNGHAAHHLRKGRCVLSRNIEQNGDGTQQEMEFASRKGDLALTPEGEGAGLQ